MLSQFLGAFLGMALVMGIVEYLKYRHKKKLQAPQPVVVPAPQVNVNLKPLEDKMAELPNKVLQSITSSANTHKGALGELIGYINLRSSYDRIIPLGNIVDFMCIKFPDGENTGHVDFIDIKTGNRSRLSKDQKNLQKLIEDKRINFVKLKVDTTHNEDPS
jgi:predicted Holliday junction resolvase-like endonuclease